jgi:hypothetical protein
VASFFLSRLWTHSPGTPAAENWHHRAGAWRHALIEFAATYKTLEKSGFARTR